MSYVFLNVFAILCISYSYYLPFEFEESITMMYPVPGTNPVTVKAARLILVVLATVKCVLESFT